jgi:hypothetical protein
MFSFQKICPTCLQREQKCICLLNDAKAAKVVFNVSVAIDCVVFLCRLSRCRRLEPKFGNLQLVATIMLPRTLSLGGVSMPYHTNKVCSQQARMTAPVRLSRSAPNERTVLARDKPPAENEVRHSQFQYVHCDVRFLDGSVRRSASYHRRFASVLVQTTTN